MIDVPLIGIICFLGLIIGKNIGWYCRDEIKDGRPQLYVAQLLVILLAFFFYAQHGLSVWMLIVFGLMMLGLKHSPIVFLIAAIGLLFTNQLFLMGSSLFLYAFISGMLHAEEDFIVVLNKHVGICVALIGFFL